MFQQITIVGIMGQEPSMKYTPAGIAVCNISVVVNKRSGKGEEKKEISTWFKTSLWRATAEYAAQYSHKGDLVLIVGEVKTNAYLDKQGQAQASLEINAQEFKILKSKNPPNGQGGLLVPSEGTHAEEMYDDGVADIPF